MAQTQNKLYRQELFYPDITNASVGEKYLFRREQTIDPAEHRLPNHLDECFHWAASSPETAAIRQRFGKLFTEDDALFSGRTIVYVPLATVPYQEVWEDVGIVVERDITASHNRTKVLFADGEVVVYAMAVPGGKDSIDPSVAAYVGAFQFDPNLEFTSTVNPKWKIIGGSIFDENGVEITTSRVAKPSLKEQTEKVGPKVSGINEGTETSSGINEETKKGSGINEVSGKPAAKASQAVDNKVSGINQDTKVGSGISGSGKRLGKTSQVADNKVSGINQEAGSGINEDISGSNR